MVLLRESENESERERAVWSVRNERPKGISRQKNLLARVWCRRKAWGVGWQWRCLGLVSSCYVVSCESCECLFLFLFVSLLSLYVLSCLFPKSSLLFLEEGKKFSGDMCKLWAWLALRPMTLYIVAPQVLTRFFIID